MSINAALRLDIDSPLIRTDAENFTPPSWPPPREFPVVIDRDGNVVSRYGDSSWHLWPWAKKPISLSFGDGPQRAGSGSISPPNADLLRQVAAWWLYGPQAVRTAGALRSRFVPFRALFVLCSQEGVLASDLARFPAVADRLPKTIPASQAEGALQLLHRLYEQRDQLGFTLLDRAGLSRFEAALPEHETRQTPYMPPRIWTYQVNRLREFLDDFRAHKDSIEECFRFCLDAYAKNAGSLAEVCQFGIDSGRRPFCPPKQVSGARTGAKFYGPFSEIAQRFSIEELLRRWLLQPGESMDGQGRGVRMLSSYLNLSQYASLAYILNFSMMRVEEGWSLRANCLEVENDDRFGPIYLIQGPTTKTVKDGDARWVTSPSAQVAVDVMTSVARLRMVPADANPLVPTTPEDLENPYLASRSYEPWARRHAVDQPLDVRPQVLHYMQVNQDWPNLFDDDELRITETDLQMARMVTPTLDAEDFAVGKIWPLAWHQLRRTGAVNMQASGFVSDASVQYQLKHASRAMSLYYGQGYSRARLSVRAQNEYVRTMYEILGKEIARLFSDRFVSPHGAQRKTTILRLVDPADGAKLTAAAKVGSVSWRETLLGGCTKSGPCEFGGVDNVVRCGGGDGQAPCIDALFDREKAPSLQQLGRVIALRLIDAPVDSPYRDSLEAQKRAVENALDVIAS